MTGPEPHHFCTQVSGLCRHELKSNNSSSLCTLQHLLLRLPLVLEEGEVRMRMEKRRACSTVGCLLRVGVLLCLLLLQQPSGAAAVADSTWHPTRRGHYDAPTRQESNGIGAKVSLRTMHRVPARYHGLPPLEAPAPTAGADLPSLPPRGPARSRSPESSPGSSFPLQPTVGTGYASPPVPSAGTPSAGEGYPFIGSNPTVPLPTGMTDTATVLPLPDRGDDNGKVAGHASLVRVQISRIGPMVVFTMLCLSRSYFSF